MTQDPELRAAVEILKGLRKKAGLTQRELGRRMGVNHSTVASFEKPSANPRLGTVLRYLGAIGATLADLHRELEGEPPQAGAVGEALTLESLAERVGRLEGLVLKEEVSR